MTAVESDIDRFIREQKAKLAQERDALVDDSRSRGEGPRRQWDKSEGSVAKLAEQQTDDQKAAGYDYTQVHRRLLEEKRKDYNDLLEKQLAKAQATLDPPGQGPPGDGERRHRQAREDERRDFLQHLEKVRSEQPVRRGWEEPREEQGLPLGGYESRRKQLEEERHRDYLALQAQTRPQPEAPPRDRNRDLPPKPPTPGGFLGRLGRDKEEEKRRLREERQRELNQHLSHNDYRSRRRPEDDDSYLKKFPGFALDTDSAKNRKVKERNEEYNQFLREKEERERHRYDHRKPTNAVPQERPDSGIYATLPGLRYSNSAQSNSNYVPSWSPSAWSWK